MIAAYIVNYYSCKRCATGIAVTIGIGRVCSARFVEAHPVGHEIRFVERSTSE